MTDRQIIRAKSLDAAVHFVDMLRPTRLFTVGLDGRPSAEDSDNEALLVEKVFDICSRLENFILDAASK